MMKWLPSLIAILGIGLAYQITLISPEDNIQQLSGNVTFAFKSDMNGTCKLLVYNGSGLPIINESFKCIAGRIVNYTPPQPLSEGDYLWYVEESPLLSPIYTFGIGPNITQCRTIIEQGNYSVVQNLNQSNGSICLNFAPNGIPIPANITGNNHIIYAQKGIYGTNLTISNINANISIGWKGFVKIINSDVRLDASYVDFEVNDSVVYFDVCGNGVVRRSNISGVIQGNVTLENVSIGNLSLIGTPNNTESVVLKNFVADYVDAFSLKILSMENGKVNTLLAHLINTFEMKNVRFDNVSEGPHIKANNITLDNVSIFAKGYGMVLGGTYADLKSLNVIGNYSLFINTTSSNISIKDSYLEGPIMIDGSSNIHIFNNIINATNPFTILGNVSLMLNTTKTNTTNIIGGPFVGGNFWANPNGTGFSELCKDSDFDGICDTPYSLASFTDFLPLTFVGNNPDVTPPNITLLAPKDRSVFRGNPVSVTFSFNVSEQSVCTLYVNGFKEWEGNSSGVIQVKKSFWIGTYKWYVECVDNAGNMGRSSEWSFEVRRPPSGGTGGGGGGGYYHPPINVTENVTENVTSVNATGNVTVVVENETENVTVTEVVENITTAAMPTAFAVARKNVPIWSLLILYILIVMKAFYESRKNFET